MRSTHAALIAVSCLTLAGCGGGGGGGGGGAGGGGGGGNNVAADFALATSQISFSGVQNGPAPAAQTVTVGATGGTFGTNGTVYLSSSVSGNAVDRSEITNCVGTTCSLVVTPRVNAPPGNYSSTVTVTGCTNFQCVTPVGTPKTLTATLTVGSGATLTSPAAVTIVSAPNALPVAQTLLVQSTQAGASWTASITYEAGTPGWLAPIAAGTGSQTVILQASMQPTGNYRARVTFQPDGGGTGTSTVVNFSVRTPRVDFVTPYVGVAGQAADVTIRGSGFAAAPQVTFGAMSATNVTLTSDTEIRARAPALLAGRYPVTVSSGGLVMAGAPELVVVDPPAFAYAAIARSGGVTALLPGQLVYDAERRKVFLFDPNSNAVPGSPLPPSPGQPAQRIERYRFAGGGWTVDEALPPASTDVPYSTSTIALSPDGRELLRSQRQSITHFDAAAINNADSLPTATSDARGALGANTGLISGAMANDGSFVGPAISPVSGPILDLAYRYDSKDRVFYQLVPPATWTHAQWRIAIPTPTGRRVILPYAAAGLPRPTYEYSASSGAITEVTPSGTVLARVWSYSRDASVWMWGYRDSMNDWFEVTFPDPRLGGALSLGVVHHPIEAAVVAPNGQRLYYYEATQNRVHALDLSNPQQVVNIFPEVAQSAPIDPPGAGAQMLITPDGGNLIIAGKDRLIVMPTP